MFVPSAFAKTPVPELIAADVWRRVLGYAEKEAWAEVRRELDTLPRAERRSVVQAGMADLAREEVAEVEAALPVLEEALQQLLLPRLKTSISMA